jgi:hypothetical protein
MSNNAFDIKFQEITTEMVEIAFEYVNFDKNEVEKIYVFGSIEDDTYVYQMFYKVNGEFVHPYQVPSVSKITEGINDERLSVLLGLGNKCLIAIDALFREFKRDVPTLIKISFEPKNGKFNCNLSYDLQYSYDELKSHFHVYKKWFQEEKEKSQNT